MKKNTNQSQMTKRKIRSMVCIHCEICPNINKCPIVSCRGMIDALDDTYMPLLVMEGKRKKDEPNYGFCNSNPFALLFLLESITESEGILN